MTVLRIDIERALDELIGDEEGMRFQALAVVLAKQKWPDLVARERKRDEGLDAYAPASLAINGIGKGLACSTTATLGKVKSDAEKVHEHFNDVTVLIFATPAKVTGTTAAEWANSIKQAHDLDLVVMSREEFVTQLMLPGNAALVRSQLRIPVPVETEIAELHASAQAAAAEVIASWFSHPRLAGRPKMSLQAIGLDENGRDTEVVFNLQDLRRALLAGRRVVLEAPAGRGKTTMLLQLADGLSSEGLPLLVDLPAWLTSTGDVLEFIARSQPFRSRRIDAQDLARLLGAISCAFLLNGWNEISDDYASKAQAALAELERGFPSAGIIVATRTHHIKPPLPGSFRARIPLLTRSQRTDYLRQAVGGRANELRGVLERDGVLDDLTRTPLILAEVASIFLSGRPIPTTKMGVLGAAFDLAEQGEEHQGHLATAPLYGHGRQYLTALAMRMTSAGAVAIDEAEARSLIHAVGTALNTAGQISALPQPAAILGTLTAHHLLERIDYPAITFRFEHQQFQEFLAAAELGQRLRQVFRRDDPDSAHEYARTYIDLPTWEEALRMIAEEIGIPSVEARDEADAVGAGASLIEMALTVDPVFAASLSQLCGPGVWNAVRRPLGARLRAWRQVIDEHHRWCALAGMIASGSDDFVDVLVPLLTSDDPQVRLRTYRSWRVFFVSSLGPGWRRVVGAWKEEFRVDFVSELRHGGGTSAILEEFASTDPSPNVRDEALLGLSWLHETDAVTRVITKLNDAELARILKKRVLLDIPDEAKPRALRAYQGLLETANEPIVRIRTRLSVHELGGNHMSEALKTDLNALASGSVAESDQELLRSALEVLEQTDRPWVSAWVAERIVNGSLWPERWVRLVTTVPDAFRENLLDRLSDQELEYPHEHRIIAVLAAVSDAGFMGRVFSQLRRSRADLESGAAEPTQPNWAIVRQLRDLIRAAPPGASAAGILGALSPTTNLVEYETVTDLFSSERGDEPHLREQLPENLRQPLRRYLKDGLSLILAQDDFSGGLKAHSAMALAILGEPEDMADLERLISADVQRVRNGQAARVRGDRTAAANGAATRQSSWYVRAVTWLDPAGAERVLLALLSEPEYELDAAKALVKLAGMEISNRMLGASTPNYTDLWNAREGKTISGTNGDRPERFASAIKQRISEIRRDPSEQVGAETYTADWVNMRLKGLAAAVAALNGRESVDFVMDVLQLPGEWDTWIKVDALEALLFRGARLGAEEALYVLDPVLDTLRSQLNDQQSAYLLQRCLAILPFIEPCAMGIGRLRDSIAGSRFAFHELRPIVTALGYSRCSDALQLLMDITIHKGGNFSVFGIEWIDAIAAAHTSEAELVLWGFVDPTVGSPVRGLRLEHHHQERIAQHLAEIASRDSAAKARLFALCKTPLEAPSRSILASATAQLQTEDAMITGLELIDDQQTPSIPYELLRGIENFVLERRPFEGSSGTYTMEPRTASALRDRLFALLIRDANRRRSAWELLGQVESWRLDYGRPGNEPRHPAIESGKPWPPLEDVTTFAA